VIGMLKGKVWEIQEDKLILDVQGVGYLLNVPLQLLGKLRYGQELTLYTHLVVREDELSLYGFASLEEKRLFLDMLGVSGIGPKAALAVLSTFGTVQIQSAIATGNVALLTKVPGVGKKSAQRLIVELKDKIGKRLALTESETVGISHAVDSEAVETLLALGFHVDEARGVLAKVKANAEGELPVEEQVRRALRELARL